MTDTRPTTEERIAELRRLGHCIETTWPRDRKGYGFRMMGGVRWRAHRYAWTQARGPIPAGMHICHHCDNPPCINPDHLFLGTNQDNVDDRHRKGRDAKGATHGWVTHPERHPRGKKYGDHTGTLNGRALLTEADVQAMRAAYAEGERIADLARRFGVAWSTVEQNVKGRRWTHVRVTFARAALSSAQKGASE